MVTTLELKTNSQTEFLEITDLIQDLVSESKFTDGLCQIFIPHTTAAVTINENADPTVKKDMNKIVPFEDNYLHFEGNSAAHIKSSLIGPSLSVIVQDKRLMLGTWQGIFFCEFDGPRRRKIWVKMIGG